MASWLGAHQKGAGSSAMWRMTCLRDRQFKKGRNGKRANGEIGKRRKKHEFFLFAFYPFRLFASFLILLCVLRCCLMSNWDPQQYQRFGDERSRPFFDLVNRVPDDDVHAVADLGCGPGNLTETLVTRWPEAHIWGMDSSP